MNYKKIHDNIINYRVANPPKQGYCEVHHITPKSFGGSDDTDNLVKLTGREHFIIHRLLAKIYPDTGMAHAAWRMACTNKENDDIKVIGRVYEYLREQHSIRVSNDLEAARKKSEALRGRKQSKEHIQNRTESRLNNGIWHSEETRKKIGKANNGKSGHWAGKKLPSDVIAKRNAARHANGNYGWSEEAKRKVSEKLKGISRGPKPEEVKAKQRKKYLVNDEIVVTNAKKYCDENGLRYQKFITAANHGNLYKGLKISKIT